MHSVYGLTTALLSDVFAFITPYQSSADYEPMFTTWKTRVVHNPDLGRTMEEKRCCEDYIWFPKHNRVRVLKVRFFEEGSVYFEEVCVVL